MTKEEVIDLIKDAGFGFLATTDGKQPKVRPMMPHLTDDGNLLLAIIDKARTITQIKENPLVEMCFVDRKMCFCRISGYAKISDDLGKKEATWNNIPMLRQYFSGPEDAKFVLIEIDTKTVEATTPHQQTPDILSLK